jgi:hypothetical protein
MKYLRFLDQETPLSVLQASNLTNTTPETNGYHINIIGELTEELEIYKIEPPKTLYRVFAGYQ